MTEEDSATDPLLDNTSVEADDETDGTASEDEALLANGGKVKKGFVITHSDPPGINNLESMLHLLKGNVGTGILAMPSAVKYAGLWTGLFGIGIIGIAAVHCMHLLVKAAAKLCARFHGEKFSYDACAEKAVYMFFQKEKLAKMAKLTINIFLCITQFGFCIVYILFIATNIKQFVERFTNQNRSVRMYQAFVTAFLIPFCWIKSLKVLAPFSMVANILTAVGLVVILEYCVKDLPPYTVYPAFAEITSLPLFFGITIYAFEGISLILPIENKMKTPQDFPGLTGVLNTGMVIVTVLYMAVGFYGYMRFGESVEGSITLNMPNDVWLYFILKVVFSVVIFISYGVQFYVPAVILIPFFQEKINCSSRPVLINCLVRAAFVIFTFLVSIIVPHLDLMIALIGALASSSLALIFPPIIDILICWPHEMGKYKWMLWKNLFIIIFGIFGFFTGTITTLIQIYTAFSKDV